MTKAKAATLMFLITILLSSTLIIILAARLEPGISYNKKSGEAEPEEVVKENCEGVGEEECLMRRTLAAHVDYIYSQEHNKP